MPERRCPQCGRPLKVGQTLCSLDVIFAAHKAGVAYEEFRRRDHLDPKKDTDRLVVGALAYIDSGHTHHFRAQLGCPFCRIPA